MPNSISESEIIERAPRAEGFDVVRFADAARQSGQCRDGLGAFLAAGHHGEMDWMETRADGRADPASAVAGREKRRSCWA